MTKQKEKRRYFKLEWNCSTAELIEFYEAVKKVTSQAICFRANFGEIYLCVKGVDNESNLYGEMLTDFETIEDVLHEWRKKIRLLRTLTRRPTPEKYWRGQWSNL